MLYDILVIDDEEWIRNGIISKIKKYHFEFSNILEADNGENAIEIIENYKPHIVITDIRMPCLDGIQLIEKVKPLYPKTKFIIVSGYAEFEYAEQAINMGVSGYLLKPIHKSNFIKTMKSVLDELDHEKEVKIIKRSVEDLERSKQKLLLERSINEIFHSAKEGRQDKEIHLPGSGDGYKYILILVNIDGSSYYQSEFKYEDRNLVRFSLNNIIDELNENYNALKITNYKDKNQLFIILKDTNMEKLKKNSDKLVFDIYNKATRFLKISITLAISSIQSKVNEKLYKDTKKAFDLRLIHGNNRIYRIEDAETKRNFTFPDNKLHLLGKYIQFYDVKNIKIILEYIFLIEHYKEASGAHIRSIFTEVMNVFLKACSKLGLDIDDKIDPALLTGQIFDSFSSMDDIVNYLYTAIVDMLQTDEQSNFIANKCQDMVCRVIRFIKTYYREDLTVKRIAREFSINPNYLSTILKNETGKTVLQYLTCIRMNNACELLKNTDANISEISQTVGYHDPPYFSRVFKKVMGIPPLEYRNNRI